MDFFLGVQLHFTINPPYLFMFFCKTPHIQYFFTEFFPRKTARPQSVGRFPSGSARGAEGCQLIYISFVSLRQAEASSRRVLHDTMGQMDAMV